MVKLEDLEHFSKDNWETPCNKLLKQLSVTSQILSSERGNRFKRSTCTVGKTSPNFRAGMAELYTALCSPFGRHEFQLPTSNNVCGHMCKYVDEKCSAAMLTSRFGGVFFVKILEDTRPFRGATPSDTPVLDFW